MEKLWLKSYEQGVNPEIDISQYSSISDVFRQSVEKFADKPAFQKYGQNTDLCRSRQVWRPILHLTCKMY